MVAGGMVSSASLRVLGASCNSNSRTFEDQSNDILGSPLHGYGHRIRQGKRKASCCYRSDLARRVAPLPDHLRSPRQVPSTLFTCITGNRTWPLQCIDERQVAEIEGVRKAVFLAKKRTPAMHFGDVNHTFESIFFTPDSPSSGRVKSGTEVLDSSFKTPSPSSKAKGSSLSPPDTIPRTPQLASSAQSSPRRSPPQIQVVPQSGGSPIKRPVSRFGTPYVRESAQRSGSRLRRSFAMGHLRQALDGGGSRLVSLQPESP